MTPTPRIRRALALAVAASLAAAAPAAASPEPVLVRGTGLSAPTGVAQTPDGARWVADGLRGVCRVQRDGTGVVGDLYCSDEHVEAHVGPISTTGLVFDVKTENFYAGDIQSNHGGVWRLHWDKATGRIDRADMIKSVGDDRVTAVGMAPASEYAPATVVYATKRSAAVMAIEDPAGHAPAAAPIGFAGKEATGAVAVLDRKVYVADGAGLMRFPLAGGAPVAVPGTDGLAVSALTVDHERGRVYAGTTFDGFTDEVVAIEASSGTVETYERGFAGITGLGVEADGTLLVGDDPGVAAFNLDSLDQGRLFAIGHHAFGRGQATITAAPDAVTSAASVSFEYEAPHATFACRLDGGEWTACGGYGSGSDTFDALGEGTHVFELRATTAAGTGATARRVFTIDRTAPAVELVAPAGGGTVVTGRGRVDMVAGEHSVAWTCAVDGGDAFACEPGQALPASLSLGEHTVRVSAEDAAGNRSAEAVARFTVVAPPAIPVVPLPTVERDDEPAAVASPDPVAPAAGPAPVAPAAPAFVPRGEVAGATTASAPRLGSLRLRTTRGPAGALRSLRLELRAGAGARLARVTLRSSAGVTVAVRDLRVEAGAANRLTVTLTGAERRRVRPGRYAVSVSLIGARGLRGTGRTQVLSVTAR